MKRYKVVGSQPVLDNPPGKTFSADLDPGQEKFLLDIGALKVVESKKKS